jgi:AhpD family alkylhydroperoxidase
MRAPHYFSAPLRVITVTEQTLEEQHAGTNDQRRNARPECAQVLIALGQSAKNDDVPETTPHLIRLRASQINGCSVCTEMHSGEMKKAGEPDERVFAVAAWRDSPYFNDAERAALALTEAATRMAGRPDPVSDEVWDEAAKHYDERAMASLLLEIATINAFNRLSVPTRQPSGQNH